MAKTAKKAKEETKITRIKASDAKPAPRKKPANSKVSAVKSSPVKATRVTESEGTKGRRNPLAAMLGYVTGSWYELRQVRWPDRRATWSMTGALLAFTGFFVVAILLLDAGFSYLFKLIMGTN